jgi:hypothetical protein
MAQGVLPDMPTGTDTMFFISYSALPSGCQATYLFIIAELKPNKAETRCIRFTVGAHLQLT